MSVVDKETADGDECTGHIGPNYRDYLEMPGGQALPILIILALRRLYVAKIKGEVGFLKGDAA